MVGKAALPCPPTQTGVVILKRFLGDLCLSDGVVVRIFGFHGVAMLRYSIKVSISELTGDGISEERTTHT